MSKRLEDFIKHNREEFDDLEPNADLWNRIEERLPVQHEAKTVKLKPAARTFTLSFVLKVAAVIVVVMGIGFAVYLHNEHKQREIDLAAINPEYAKQQLHYASLVEAKRTEVMTVAKSDPQLYREFSAEIDKMDSTYKKLNHDLATSPNQERILRAMIRNLQIQTEVLNQQLDVIEQYNHLKNQNHEAKSI